ncbi:MAG: hypothetical protein WBA89_01535 [Microcoleus sp.]|uniref:hypothetical protein n=1 Tax=Microcoleus sp. TaxID=44472 RepID=UPI003C764252
MHFSCPFDWCAIALRGEVWRDRQFRLFYNCIDLAQKPVIAFRHQRLGQPKT